MNFLQTIFSVKNVKNKNKYHKVLTVLGIKFKFKYDKDRANFKQAQKNYSIILKRLRNKYNSNQKIKVVFIVSENQKWSYQRLYELLDNSDKFEPIVLISLLIQVHDGRDTTRNNLEDNYNFFKSRGMNVDFLYKDGNYSDLESFNPDIVFYDQQWDMPKKYMPNQVSKYALALYSSYGYEVLDYIYNYTNKFHIYLYGYFIEHKLNLKRYKTYSKFAQKNCVIIGYPKIDEYTEASAQNNDSVWKNPEKIKIIYAPHHSFDNLLHGATFMDNYKFILDLAKSYPETTWIFKPHPRLNFALLKTGLMNEEEIENYYNEWRKIGVVYTQGGYINIFKTSDAMITDCLSFLAEYLPSKKPVIRLMKKDAIPLNDLGEHISSQYYETYDNEELQKVFDEVVIEGKDYKKDARLKIIDEIIDYNYPASKKIFDFIKKELEK